MFSGGEDLDNMFSGLLSEKGKYGDVPTNQQIESPSLDREISRRPKPVIVDWRTALVNDRTQVNDKAQIFHGRIRDITMEGFSIILDHNLNFSHELTALISVPPLTHKESVIIVEARAKIDVTVYSGEFRNFRIWAKFLGFKGDGQSIIGKYLKHRKG